MTCLYKQRIPCYEFPRRQRLETVSKVWIASELQPRTLTKRVEKALFRYSETPKWSSRGYSRPFSDSFEEAFSETELSVLPYLGNLRVLSTEVRVRTSEKMRTRESLKCQEPDHERGS